LTTIVEVRCPNNARRLFVKLRQEGERPAVTSDNLMEFACADCRRALAAKQVFHRYDLAGQLIESEVVTE
jgi:hypothetical protein